MCPVMLTDTEINPEWAASTSITGTSGGEKEEKKEDTGCAYAVSREENRIRGKDWERRGEITITRTRSPHRQSQ